ncbi:MAG: CocE/NonD family hydrolase [Thermodesulfobacteriota bacterium]
MVKTTKEEIRVWKFGDEEIEVIFRKAKTREEVMKETTQRFVYPPPSPSVTIENGIRIENDVVVRMRDGATIFVNIYRPEGATKVPAIVAWSPYGKFEAYGERLMLPIGVPPGAISSMAKFESPDPAYWCHYGYAVINPDVRGAGNSEGEVLCFGTRDGKDGYDLIEWVASQDWCNGKVGLTGNSWVAMAQWYIAAEKPPHLACIAPWGATSDIYREFVAWGGIPEVGFSNMLIRWVRNTLHGRATGVGLAEDYLAMIRKYPLMNAYWEDKVACFENIEIPVYVTACWLHFHLHGSIEGFRRIASPKKWLRLERDSQWADACTPENLEDLGRFFGRYLKDIRNGWELTPRVRVTMMDYGDVDYQVNRPEKEFPLARTQYKKLFLDARTSRLLPEPVEQESSVRYDAAGGLATFTIRFDEDTELTGYLKLRLWVEADGSDDMDLFVTVQKLDEKGAFVPLKLIGEPHPGLPGKLRVSHRELDEEQSTVYQPIHTHRREQLLKPGEIVPVEIEIWPTSLLWHAGQQLRLVVSGHYIREPGWFEPFAWDLRNRGYHIIHTGEKYDSHLLVPVIPSKYTTPLPKPVIPPEYTAYDGLIPWRALHWLE